MTLIHDAAFDLVLKISAQTLSLLSKSSLTKTEYKCSFSVFPCQHGGTVLTNCTKAELGISEKDPFYCFTFRWLSDNDDF